MLQKAMTRRLKRGILILTEQLKHQSNRLVKCVSRWYTRLIKERREHWEWTAVSTNMYSSGLRSQWLCAEMIFARRCRDLSLEQGYYSHSIGDMHVFPRNHGKEMSIRRSRCEPWLLATSLFPAGTFLVWLSWCGWCCRQSSTYQYLVVAVALLDKWLASGHLLIEV